jgi:hypothetical protein
MGQADPGLARIQLQERATGSPSHERPSRTMGPANDLVHFRVAGPEVTRRLRIAGARHHTEDVLPFEVAAGRYRTPRHSYGTNRLGQIVVTRR